MIRVMLIDDEEDALDLLEILLGQIGGVGVVGRYVNPVQAIEDLDRLAVDAVFLDNQMPALKGTEAARAIRAKLPQIPVVFTTAYAEYAVEAFELQSTDYLLKPFTKDRLQNAVGRIGKSLSDASLEARRNANCPHSAQCLGGFHIQLPDTDKRTMTWKTKKEKELCAFLIHHEGRSVLSASIIEALWPGYDLDKAKTYLYTCLSYLRKSLSDHGVPIQIHKGDQGFVAVGEDLTIDAAEFERLLRDTLSDRIPDERVYDQINLMYEGDYMEACDYGWAAARQTEIKELYIRALRKWSVHFRGIGKTALATDSLQRILTLAPDSEADGRELIALYLEAGSRNKALSVYLQLEEAVRDQLGADLEEGTVRLFQQSMEDTKRQSTHIG